MFTITVLISYYYRLTFQLWVSLSSWFTVFYRIPFIDRFIFYNSNRIMVHNLSLDFREKRVHTFFLCFMYSYIRICISDFNIFRFTFHLLVSLCSLFVIYVWISYKYLTHTIPLGSIWTAIHNYFLFTKTV